ncbi:MAG: DUF4080 domain-containing protein [Syntrophomonadaceae bacterium]|nr:DUF4080 domain-containing protein [Syntrophomonadaceae bacterium]
MKVLLVTLNAKFIHSSLALAYLEKYCQSDLWEIEVREYTINELMEDILADIHRAKPDILCFSCYIWNIELTLQLCQDFKNINPDIPIILGGPEVSYDSRHYLINYPIEFVIRGEGEASLKELLMTIAEGKDCKQVLGITYLKGQAIVENIDRPLIDNLDIIPFPYYNNLEKYKNKTIYYETSRGCPFNCAYCLSSTIKGVRFFSLERVEKDLAYLMTNGVKEVKFVDRTFNCHEKRALNIMQYIVDNNINTKFHFEIGAELISEEFLEFLQGVPAGIFDFEIGIQSTHPTTLTAVNRQSDWQVLSKNISKIIELGNIHIHLDLIAGLPYEDYHTFANSFNEVFNLKADKIQLGFLKLLKGSHIANDIEKFAYIKQNKPPYQVLANHVLTYDELIKLGEVEKLVNKYYNTHIVDITLDFVIRELFKGDSFSFFVSLANHWEEKDLFYIGHKRDKDYTILMEYILLTYPHYQEEVKQTLKYDYFLNNRSFYLPALINENTNIDTGALLNLILKDDNFIMQHMPHLKGKTVREMKKHLNLAYFKKDPMNNFSSSSFIIFIYSNTGPTELRDITSYIHTYLDANPITP